MEVLNQVLVNILIFFATAILIVVGNALRKWLEAKMAETEESDKTAIYGMLYDIVRIVVNGIEQMYLGDVSGAANWNSSEKKSAAVDQVMEWVNQNGYGGIISEKLISSLIEAAVKEMNDELPPVENDITPEY